MAALQYHSSPVRSAWLNTNPVNSRGSANTPQERLSTQKSCFKPNVISWPRRISGTARRLTREPDGGKARSGPVRSWQTLTQTMWSGSKLGRALPGPHEQLSTISSSVQEMHAEKRSTPSHCFPFQELKAKAAPMRTLLAVTDWTFSQTKELPPVTGNWPRHGTEERIQLLLWWA